MPEGNAGTGTDAGQAVEPSSGAGGAASGGVNAGGTAGTSSGGSGDAGPTSKFCELGEFDTSPGENDVTCQPWSDCPPGTHVVASGTYTSDRVCEPCPSESYSEDTNATLCKRARKCSFAQQAAHFPAPTTDRVCKAADVFAPLPWEGGATRTLIVTDRGAYLLAHSFGSEEVFVARYSLSGETLEPWIVLSGTGVIDIGDMARAGDDIYVTAVEKLATGGEDQRGVIKKFSPDTGLVWEAALGPSDLIFEATRIATHDKKVYVLAAVHTDPKGPTGTRLYVFEEDGEPVSATTLSPTDNDPFTFDLAIATDGHVYVSTNSFAKSSDPTQVVRRFDETGTLVATYPLPYGASVARSFVPSLLAGSAGNAFALVESRSTEPPASIEFPAWQYTLHHVRMSNDAWGSYPVELEDADVLGAFAPGHGGFVMVGHDAKHSPLLVRVDHQGQVLAREVAESVTLEPLEPNGGGLVSGITGVQQRPDGTVYVGGALEGALFVTPWPD